MLKLLLALLCVIALVCARELELSNVTSTEVDPLSGASGDLTALVDTDAAAELAGKLDVGLSAEAQAALDAKVEEALLYYEWLVNAVNVTKIVQARNELVAKVREEKAKYEDWKTNMIGNLTHYFTKWNESRTKVWEEHQAADNETIALADQVKAYLQFQLEKLAARKLAATLILFKESGAALELRHRAAMAAVWLMNNTIAKLRNGTLEDETEWTPMNHTEVLAAIKAINLAVKITESKMDIIYRFMETVAAESKRLAAELDARIREYKAQVHEALYHLKSTWLATENLNVSLADRIEVFLENVTGVNVEIENLDGLGNLSITVTLSHERQITVTLEQVKEWLGKKIKLALIALTGIAEKDVHSEVEEKVVSAKRQTATSSFVVSTQITGQDSASPAATFSLLILAVSLVAMLFY